MAQFTEFGLQVKMELLKKGKTMRWLGEEVSGRTGLYADTAYLSKILHGERTPPKVIGSICEILDLSVPQTASDKQDSE